MQNIPDLTKYAEDWRKLAADARLAGRLASADAYQKRGDWYAEQGRGEAVRIIEDSFSQLIVIDAPKDYVIGPAGLG